MAYGQKFQDFQTLPVCHPFIPQRAEVPEWEGLRFDDAFDSSRGIICLGTTGRKTLGKWIREINPAGERGTRRHGDLHFAVCTLKTSRVCVLG